MTDKGRILYKAFNVDNKGALKGPYSHREYIDAKGIKLTRRQYKGFEAKPITGKLLRCLVGYHAFDLNDGVMYSYGRVVFKIRLFKARKFDNKWIGRSFKIIGRVEIVEKRVPLKTYKSLCGNKGCCLRYYKIKWSAKAVSRRK